MTELARWLVRHLPRLRRYARALTGDAGRADDLVQDSLERAWSRRHLWRGDGDPRAWLFTIMHNVFANQARRYARTPPLVALAEADTVDPGRYNAETAVELRELAAAIAELPAPQREVLILVGLEQLSYEEVAGILNIPVGTVMSRLSRARRRLRDRLYEPDTHRSPGLRRVK